MSARTEEAAARDWLKFIATSSKKQPITLETQCSNNNPRENLEFLSRVICFPWKSPYQKMNLNPETWTWLY